MRYEGKWSIKEKLNLLFMSIGYIIIECHLRYHTTIQSFMAFMHFISHYTRTIQAYPLRSASLLSRMTSPSYGPNNMFLGSSQLVHTPSPAPSTLLVYRRRQGGMVRAARSGVPSTTWKAKKLYIKTQNFGVMYNCGYND